MPHANENPDKSVHRSTCPLCDDFAKLGFGATGMGSSGVVRDAQGLVVVHPATKLILTGEGVEECPNLEAGKPVTFERVYTRHDGYSINGITPGSGSGGPFGDDGITPPFRREGVPNGCELSRQCEQVLEWLDHMNAAGWIEHLEAANAPTWLIEHARTGQRLLKVRAETPETQRLRKKGKQLPPRQKRHHLTTRRRWAQAREAAARAILAQVHGLDLVTVRRRIQRFRDRGPRHQYEQGF